MSMYVAASGGSDRLLLDDGWFSSAPTAKPLRDAADIAALRQADVARSGGKPELAAPRDDRAGKISGENNQVRRFLDSWEAIKDVIVMLMNKIKKDSAVIGKSAVLELAVAKVQADSTIKAGNVALAGGVGKAVGISAFSFFGARYAFKGHKVQIDSTRSNLQSSGEVTSHLRGAGAEASQSVQEELHRSALQKAAAHEENAVIGSRLHVKSAVLQQMATVSSAIVDGGQNSAASVQNAKREVAAADGTVLGRQTDVGIKARESDENFRQQEFEALKNVIQADLDVMAHVAQTTNRL